MIEHINIIIVLAVFAVLPLALIGMFGKRAVLMIIWALKSRYRKPEDTINCDNCGNHWCQNGFYHHNAVQACISENFRDWESRE